MLLPRGQALLAHLFALGTSAVWGLTFISSKILLETHTPLEIIVFRFAAAAAFLFCLRPHLFRGTLPGQTHPQRVEKFLREDVCPDCGGTRLSEAARAPRLGGLSLDEACRMTALAIKAKTDSNGKVIHPSNVDMLRYLGL